MGKTVPEAVSITQAAEILGVHYITVRRWIRYRVIKAYRVGPHLIRIPRTEIARLRQIRLDADDNATRPKYPEV